MTSANGGQHARRTLGILLVDDSPQDRGMIRRELRHEFGELLFQEATNEAEFAAALDADGFDIVITDYRIRWTDGMIVLHKVKERFPLCPVLMFTATGSEETAVEAMKAGLDDYIVKNMHHTVRLRGAVRAALANAEIRRRAAYLESRLRTLLTELRIGAFSCTLDGAFLELNPIMTELLGCQSESEAITMSVASLFPQLSEADKFLRQCIDSATSQQIEIQTTRPSGENRFLRIYARRIDGASDQPLHLDGLLEDITDRKRAEARAQQADVAQAQLRMLSPREREVLNEVVAGGMNKTIARRFDISEKSVERHRSNLMRKLHIRSLAELVRLATLAENAQT